MTAHHDENKPVEEIRAELESTRGELSTLISEVDEIKTLLPEDVFQEVWESVEAESSDTDANDNVGGNTDELSSRYPEHAEGISRMRSFFSKYRELEDRLHSLEEQDKPFKLAELESTQRNVSSRLDYEAILEYYQTEHPNGSDLLMNTVSDLSFIRTAEVLIMTGESSGLDYQRVQWLESQIQQIGKRFEAKGFLRTEEDPNYTPSNEFGEAAKQRKEVLIQEMQKSLEDVMACRGNCLVYRFYYSPNQYLINERLRNLAHSLNKIPLGSSINESEDETDPRLLDAVEKAYKDQRTVLALNGMIHQDEHEALDYAQRRIHKGETLNVDSIDVQIGPVPEGNRQIIDRQLILKHAVEVLPLAFLTKIDSIKFTQKPPDEVKEGETEVAQVKGKIKETIGHFGFSQDDDGELISATIEVYFPWYIPVRRASIENMVSYQVKMINETIVHEVGHRVHFELTLDEMREWNSVMAKDAQPITWYVDDSRKISKDKGSREDFSESFMMFVESPLWLYTISPERFDYMHRLFLKYTPTERQEQFELKLQQTMSSSLSQWEEMGKTPEQQRKLWLEIEGL